MKAFFKWLATKNSRTTKCIFISIVLPAILIYIIFKLLLLCYHAFILDNHTCYCSCGNSQCQNSHWKIFHSLKKNSTAIAITYITAMIPSTFSYFLPPAFMHFSSDEVLPLLHYILQYNRKNHHNPMDDTVIFSRRICCQRNCFIF